MGDRSGRPSAEVEVLPGGGEQVRFPVLPRDRSRRVDHVERVVHGPPRPLGERAGDHDAPVGREAAEIAKKPGGGPAERPQVVVGEARAPHLREDAERRPPFRGLPQKGEGPAGVSFHRAHVDGKLQGGCPEGGDHVRSLVVAWCGMGVR